MKSFISLIIVLALAVLLAAKLERNRVPDPWLDPQLANDLSLWQQEMDSAGVNWKPGFSRIELIGVGSLPVGKAGLWDRGRRQLLISPIRAEAGHYSRRATLYHELGHAVFSLNHRDGRLMGQVALDEAQLQREWQELRREYLLAILNKQ